MVKCVDQCPSTIFRLAAIGWGIRLVRTVVCFVGHAIRIHIIGRGLIGGRCQEQEGMSAESRFEKSPVQRFGCPLNGGTVARLAVKSLLSSALVDEQTSVFKASLGESVLFAKIGVV